MPSLIPWLVQVPNGYLWQYNPKMWAGYKGRQVPYRGQDATCRSQRAARKFPTRNAALDVAATIPGAKVVPYSNRW